MLYKILFRQPWNISEFLKLCCIRADMVYKDFLLGYRLKLSWICPFRYEKKVRSFYDSYFISGQQPENLLAILYHIACLYFNLYFILQWLVYLLQIYSSNMNVDDIIGLVTLAVVVVLFLGVSFVFWSCPAPRLCGKNLVQAPKADPPFDTLV